MAKLFEVYKCEICGNIVEVLHGGAGKLVCCGEDMVWQEERREDTGYEKHLPVLEAAGDGSKISVGSTRHPMEEKHYIEWIEVGAGGKVCRQHLKPGELPIAEFAIPAESVTFVRGYCNIHGLWRADRNTPDG